MYVNFQDDGYLIQSAEGGFRVISSKARATQRDSLVEDEQDKVIPHPSRIMPKINDASVRYATLHARVHAFKPRATRERGIHVTSLGTQLLHKPKPRRI